MIYLKIPPVALQCSVILFSVEQSELATPSDHDSVCSVPLA